MLTTAFSPRFLLIAILTILIAYSQNLLAEQVEGLYEVTLPVPSQTQTSFKKATKDGLEAVFIRVSGSEQVVNQQQVVRAVSRAKKYLKQFRYERSQSGDSKQLLLTLEFEPEQVDALLREAHLPLWSSNRPSVLVWMVVEDRKGRRFASVDSDPLLVEAINRHAIRRGLAIKLPLLDLEDNLLLSPDQLWQLSSQKIQMAAKRYAADTVLVGRASHLSNGHWLGAWSYRFNDKRVRIDGDEKNIDTYIGAGFTQVADLLASDYAIAPVDITEGGLLMRLSGIRDFTDYARAITYLERVAAIRYANVIDIRGDEIIVRIRADGKLEQLQQSLALDKRLQPSLSVAHQGIYTIALDYQWR